MSGGAFRQSRTPRPSPAPHEKQKPVGENALVSVGETNTENPNFQWGFPPLRFRWGFPPLPLESRVLHLRLARGSARSAAPKQSAAQLPARAPQAQRGPG